MITIILLLYENFFMKFYFAVLILNLLITQLRGQQIINGKITDKDLQPIPDVHVYSSVSKSGTITNHEGEFTLTLYSLEDTIVVTHISFESQRIRPVANFIKVSLNPRITVLPELQVSDYAVQCIRKAFHQTIEHIGERNYDKGFYRQISFNDSVPTEILETFYDLETSCAGIEKESIAESRYGQKKKGKENQVIVHYTNFSGFVTASKIASSQSIQQKSILIPLMANAEEVYEFELVERFNINDSEYIKIHFMPSAGCNKPAIQGDLVLNAKSLKVVRMDFTIAHSLGIDYLKSPSGKEWKTFNHGVKVSYDFREAGTTCVLNYIIATDSFEFKDDNDRGHSFSVKSSLVIYQQGLKKNKHLKETTLAKDDVVESKRKKYNPEFWRNNPIIKRTPIENEIVERFEKDGVIGNFFKP